jgi:molecular chaperone DnaK
VHVPNSGGEPVVGRKASHVRLIKPAETVYSIKRFIGRRASEISVDERSVNYELGSESGRLAVALGGRFWSPEEISAEVLKKLKRDAEAFLGETVTRAVITVPAYFNDAQRNATREAGELAGLAIERIINEPTAAALAYGLDRLKEKSKIAVYDLGGGTFDLSILELHEGVFQVLATNGNTRLGGDDLDQRLVDFLSEQILKRGGPKIARDPILLARAREAAEQGQDSAFNRNRGRSQPAVPHQYL